MQKQRAEKKKATFFWRTRYRTLIPILDIKMYSGTIGIKARWGWFGDKDVNQMIRIENWEADPHNMESHSCHSDHCRVMEKVRISKYSIVFSCGKCKIGFLSPYHTQKSVPNRKKPIHVKGKLYNFYKQYRKKWFGNREEFLKQKSQKTSTNWKDRWIRL